MQSVVTSAQNQYVKLYRSLERRKVRDELGLLPLEGVRLVAEALDRGYRPEAVLLREGLGMESFPFLRKLAGHVVMVAVDAKLFAQTAFTDSPQGIMAVVRKPAHTLNQLFIGNKPLLLVVDALQDPGNLGTMLRSAAAAGAGGAVLLPGTVDSANPKVLRAAMGAHFAMPVVEATCEELLTALRQYGVPLITTGAGNAVTYDSFDWGGPAAVVIGNEGSGVSQAVAASATAQVSIPLEQGVESLNAAVAMSVIFFEAARQRRVAK